MSPTDTVPASGPAAANPLREALAQTLAKLKKHPDDGRLLDEAAVLLYQLGELAAAAQTAEAAATASPKDALIHDHLGLILLAAGRAAEGAAAARRAAALAPRDGAIALNLGNALLAAGDLPAALSALERATALIPREPLAWFNRGNALAQARERRTAQSCLRQSVALAPRFTPARRNLALLLREDGQLPEALATLAPSASSDDPELLHLFGVLLLDKPDPNAALSPLQRAVTLAPASLLPRLDLARCLLALRRLPEAQAECDHVLARDPRNCDAWNLRGLAAPDTAEAIRSFRAALDLNPAFADAAINLARALASERRHPEALAVLAALPESAANLSAVQCARGYVLSEAGRAAEADAAFRSALAAAPDHPQANWLHALALLEAGDYAAGWPAYEWRWQTDVKGERRFTTLPDWPAGAPREGRLLVWSEQGIGDEIMFAALVPAVQTRVTRTVFTCSERLHPLFARSLPGVEVVAQPNSPRAPHPEIAADWQIPAGSLPARVWTGSRHPQGGRPWLLADPDRVATLRARHRPSGSAPIVGLAWRTTNPRNGRERSIAPEVWAGALRALPFHFLSLQYGDTAADLAIAAAAGLNVAQDPTVDCFADLDGFAALVACTDAVLTIDNSTVHFAGALGRPTWLLVPTPSDWRWLRDAETTPWYDTVRIRRRAPGAPWDSVLARTARDLATFLAAP